MPRQYSTNASTSSSVVERVCRLIALADSPYEEEARTAAYQAARLIREHGLHVVDAEPAARPARPVRAVHMRSKYRNRCRECGEMIEEGDLIVWRGRIDGAVHEECDR
jgi:hypothetical protein